MPQFRAVDVEGVVEPGGEFQSKDQRTPHMTFFAAALQASARITSELFHLRQN
jgi:hypothetical protein